MVARLQTENGYAVIVTSRVENQYNNDDTEYDAAYEWLEENYPELYVDLCDEFALFRQIAVYSLSAYGIKDPHEMIKSETPELKEKLTKVATELREKFDLDVEDPAWTFWENYL
jgi:hypothetical protein